MTKTKSAPPMTDKRAEAKYRKKLDSDVLFFVRELWRERGYELEDGGGRAPLNDIELDLVLFLVAQQLGMIRCALGTRGVGKTYIAAACIAAWRLYRDPQRKIVIVSKSNKAAKETTGLLRDWFRRVWFLKHLAPGPNNRDTENDFDVGPSVREKQPSVKAIGMSGHLEGNRAHTVIADDVETKENTLTYDAREKLKTQCAEFVQWLYPSTAFDQGICRDQCEVVYLQTPKHEETIARWLENMKVPVRAYPLCAPMPDEDTFELAPIIKFKIENGIVKAGECLFAHRFTAIDVATRRLNRSDWLRENQLCRSIGDADTYPLKLKNFIVYDFGGSKAPVSLMWGMSHGDQSTACDDITSLGFSQDRYYRSPMPDKMIAPLTGTRMRIDPAGRGGDKIGYAAISHLNGFYYARRVGGLSGGATTENIQHLAQAAFDTDCTSIVVESNNGGDSFAALLEIELRKFFCQPGERDDKPRGFACHIDLRSAQGQKELRIINTVEPLLNAHRIVLTTEIAANHDFQLQVTRITRHRGCLEHEDELDAFAGCLADWCETFANGPRQTVDLQSHELERWAKEMEGEEDEIIRWFGNN